MNKRVIFESFDIRDDYKLFVHKLNPNFKFHFLFDFISTIFH